MATHRTFGDVGHASAIRLAVLSIWFCIVAVTPYPDYAMLPEGTLEGFGIGRLLLRWNSVGSLLIESAVLQLLQLATIILIGASILFRPVRWVAIPNCVAVVILDSLTKAIGGFANHAQTAALLVLIIVSCSGQHLFHSGFSSFGQNDNENDERTSRAAREMVWLCGLVLVIPYTFIGVNRLLEGGVRIFAGDAIIYYLGASSSSFQTYPDWAFSILAYPELPQLGFVLTTVAEVSSPAILTSRRYRLVWLTFMMAFHISTALMMNIFFWENLVLLSVWCGWDVRWPTRRIRYPVTVVANAVLQGRAREDARSQPEMPEMRFDPVHSPHLLVLAFPTSEPQTSVARSITSHSIGGSFGDERMAAED